MSEFYKEARAYIESKPSANDPLEGVDNFCQRGVDLLIERQAQLISTYQGADRNNTLLSHLSTNRRRVAAIEQLRSLTTKVDRNGHFVFQNGNVVEIWTRIMRLASAIDPGLASYAYDRQLRFTPNKPDRKQPPSTMKIETQTGLRSHLSAIHSYFYQQGLWERRPELERLAAVTLVDQTAKENAVDEIQATIRSWFLTGYGDHPAINIPSPDPTSEAEKILRVTGWVDAHLAYSNRAKNVRRIMASALGMSDEELMVFADLLFLRGTDLPTGDFSLLATPYIESIANRHNQKAKNIRDFLLVAFSQMFPEWRREAATTSPIELTSIADLSDKYWSGELPVDIAKLIPEEYAAISLARALDRENTSIQERLKKEQSKKQGLLSLAFLEHLIKYLGQPTSPGTSVETPISDRNSFIVQINALTSPTKTPPQLEITGIRLTEKRIYIDGQYVKKPAIINMRVLMNRLFQNRLPITDFTNALQTFVEQQGITSKEVLEALRNIGNSGSTVKELEKWFNDFIDIADHST